MGMAELIDKWEVVNKLIQLQNQYNFYKNVWDADVLYRRLVELEIGIGKTPGIEIVNCKNCDWYREDGSICVNPKCGKSWYGCRVPEQHFCSYGERKDNGTV